MKHQPGKPAKLSSHQRNLNNQFQLVHLIQLKSLSEGKHIKKTELFYGLTSEKAQDISELQLSFFIFHLYLFARKRP